MLERDGVPRHSGATTAVWISIRRTGIYPEHPVAEEHFSAETLQPLPNAFTPGMTHCMAFALMLSQ